MERAVEQEGEERHPEPDVRDEDRPQGQVRVVQPVDLTVGQADVTEQFVDGSAFDLEQEPEDDPRHDQRQEPRDDDERARQPPSREPEVEQQGERKADDELAEERPEGELERVDDCRPACGVVTDEAVVVEPGVRGSEIGDRRGRRPLEAQHHVVDDGQGEREEQVRDRRG